MNEKELYKGLIDLTKKQEAWKENVGYVASLLRHQSIKITAKALWMLGEIGLQYPEEIKSYVEIIATFLYAKDDLLRERSVNALGRIGRADYKLIQPYFEKLFLLAEDECSKVRLSFIWASENIATNTPEAYKNYITVFSKLLDDKNIRVKIEAPEIFRVLGKRIPEYVRPFLDKLQYISENDEEKTVRIHAKGAIKSILNNS